MNWIIWIIENKEWLFSGIGVVLIGAFISWLLRRGRRRNDIGNKSAQHLKMYDNPGQVNQIQNNYAPINNFQQQPNNTQRYQIGSNHLRIMLNYLPKTGFGTAFTVEVVNPNPELITIKNVSLLFSNNVEVSYSELILQRDFGRAFGAQHIVV